MTADLQKRISNGAAKLNADELEVLAVITDRLSGIGREVHGALDISTDGRDFEREELDEHADGMVYRAIQIIRARRERGLPEPELSSAGGPSGGEALYGTTTVRCRDGSTGHQQWRLVIQVPGDSGYRGSTMLPHELAEVICQHPALLQAIDHRWQAMAVAALEQPKHSSSGLAVWWLTAGDFAVIGEDLPPSLPAWLQREYSSARGRNGRGRLWVSPELNHMPLPAIGVPCTPLAVYTGRCCGILIPGELVGRLGDLPGLVTDVECRRWEAQVAP